MQKQTGQLSDREVIRNVLAGDVNAFELLIERYRAHVFAVVCRHIPKSQSEEVAHNIFIKAYQGLPGFMGKSGFKQWLTGIAIRTCYDFWRRQYRSREIPMSQLSDTHREWLENTITEDADRTFDENGRIADAREILQWALSRLSAADRMVIDLVYLEELSHKEAAALLGWSVANVKIRAHRARKILHKTLVQEMERNTKGP